MGLKQSNVSYLVKAALILLGIGVLNAMFTYFQRYNTEWIASHIGYDLRNRLYDHIQHLSFSYHDHAQTGQLISRTIEDVRSVERFAGSSVVELIQVVLAAGGRNDLVIHHQSTPGSHILAADDPIGLDHHGFWQAG